MIRQKYSDEDRRMFGRYFGATLSEYWDNLFGLDTIDLEELVYERAERGKISLDPDDSLAEQVEQVFGVGAINLVFRLMGMPERWDGKELEVLDD